MSETYQSIYKKLLSSSQLQPLNKFKSSKSFNIIYPDALKYPEFFNSNLTSQGRVIKLVRGKSALIRAFCYQLMKVTFEIEVSDVDYVQIFKNIIFHPDLLLEDSDMQSPSSGKAYTDRQYKRIIADFIEIMVHQSIPNFEMTIMEYSIVEEALVRTIQSIIAQCFTASSNYKTAELLQWLSKTFEVGVERHGKCFRFQQSDVFIYHENDEEFYIAFLNEMAEVSDYSESTYRFDGRNSRQQAISNKFIDKSFKNSSPELERHSMELQDYQLPIYPSDKYRYSAQIYNPRKDQISVYRKTIDNKSSFIKELAREVDESVHNEKPSQKDKYSKIGSLLDIMSDRSSKDIPYKTQQISSERLSNEEENKATQQLRGSQHQEQMTPQFTTNLYLQEDHFNPFTKKYSEQYMGNLYQKNRHYDFITEKQDTNKFAKYAAQNAYKFDGQPNFNYQKYYSVPQYKKQEGKKTAVDYYAPYQSDTYKKSQQQQDLIYKPKPIKPTLPSQTQKVQEKTQDSRGTLYRQFTDTRVLQIMTSFERMKVNVMRQKYKGKHRRDLKNIY